METSPRYLNKANQTNSANDEALDQTDMGQLKCNIDAAIFPQERKVGAVGIIRDGKGCVVAAFCSTIHGNHNSTIAEALSFREVLSWVKKLNLHYL